MSPAIEMKNVSKGFNGQSVLTGLDWSVAKGRVVGLVGRNGAGKSTLLQCALGLCAPEAGSVRVLDEDPATLSDHARARIGYVPQNAELFEWLTAEQLLAYFRTFYPRWNQSKIDALLERWSIPTQIAIGKLSGGERQRLSIVRALAHDPELLLLDEPVAALDPAGRRDFLRELVERAAPGDTTIVFSTHILSDLERIAMDLALLKDGRIVLAGPLDQLADQVRRVEGPTDVLLRTRWRRELARSQSRDARTTLVVMVDEDNERTLESLAGEGVRVQALGLEDWFIEATQTSEAVR
jgi:ABC-2 type transport system ATP-binding protein